MLAPAGAVLCLACFLVTVWGTRYVSLGSIVASVALGPFAYLTDSPWPVVAAAVTSAALVLERHRSNLARLQAGTEARIGQRV
jgi:glycerol-3-phosphate acyltransferase PlsY